MAVQSKEENKLITTLPSDYEVVQEDDKFWLMAFLELPTGETFTWKYLIEDQLEILQKGIGVNNLVPNTVVSNNQVVESQGQITTEMWNNSFNFGTVNQLYQISGIMEEGATSYEYLVETIKEEAKTAPWLLSTDENGNYDYLAVALEAAQEGRTPRDSELMNTTWYRTHTDAERKAVKFKASDPASYNAQLNQTYDSIVSNMMQQGFQNINPDLVSVIATNNMIGTTGYATEDDVTNILNKLKNDRLPYSLPVEVQAIVDGKPVESIIATQGIANDIEDILGPGSTAGLDLESIANERQANPYWYAETYIPSLQDSFVAAHPQYKGTNVKKYSSAAAQWRYEWQTLVGQAPDEQSEEWAKFIATNDIKEREDIAFKIAADLGTQTYQDKAVKDLTSVFGQPGQRVTGGTMWNTRVK
tara:strand:+ start:188 stop:1438 length:1251 start_codon:yes stop_codon:yes gene_type:complete